MLLSDTFDAQGFNFENKIFLGTRPFEYLKYISSNILFKILHKYYPLRNSKK